MENVFDETEQLAFYTQNIIPDIDFTDDPLLQGRNFSCLDTQTKRLGGPNFPHIPINAPGCPFHHFHQDGHMAMHNPTGRANYEPNSWAQGGPVPTPRPGSRATRSKPRPQAAFAPESFADRYDQARQFYISQSPVEQDHIANGFAFELTKCVVADIRDRILPHLPLRRARAGRSESVGQAVDPQERARQLQGPQDGQFWSATAWTRRSLTRLSTP